MDKVALQRVLLLVLRLLLLFIIPQLLDTYLSPRLEVFDGPDQAAAHHTFVSKLGPSSVSKHLAGL